MHVLVLQNTTVLVVPNTWRYVSGCTSAPEKDLAEPQKCSQIVCRSHGGARKNLPPSSLTFVLAVLPLRASALLRIGKGFCCIIISWFAHSVTQPYPFWLKSLVLCKSLQQHDRRTRASSQGVAISQAWQPERSIWLQSLGAPRSLARAGRF